MINTLTRATTLGALLISASLVNLAPAFSQAPTQAQRDAIKSECRSDYMAHCSSIPPGGMESLQCLQKNMSSLAPGCQSAVRAVEAPAEPKAETKPESAPAKQCAGCRDSQRVPIRLSKSLRRCTDRRGACAAMSGKEQVESLGSLRKS